MSVQHHVTKTLQMVPIYPEVTIRVLAAESNGCSSPSRLRLLEEPQQHCRSSRSPYFSSITTCPGIRNIAAVEASLTGK